MTKNPLRTKFVWLDGKFVSFDKAQIHLLNHSLHYGSAAFEGERFYLTSRGSAIFRLPEHTERLFSSAKAIGIKIPYTKEQIIRVTRKLIRKNKLTEGYIRPIAFYGAKMGLFPGGSPVHVAIAAWPWGAYLGEKPIKVRMSPIMRSHPDSVFPYAKISGYYANSIFATREAREAGFDEALLLDANGFVAEGPGENIFMVKQGILYTPMPGSILPGITRASIIQIAGNMGIRVKEKKIKPHELRQADELFFTGTAAEVTPIGMIDSKKIGNGGVGPVTHMLKEQYLRAVRGEDPKYYRWLTLV